MQRFQDTAHMQSQSNRRGHNEHKTVCLVHVGAKADPTRVRIADIAECSGDALARAVRFRLRKDHGITTGFDVVLSLEKPRCKLVDAGGAGSNPLDYQVWVAPGLCRF